MSNCKHCDHTTRDAPRENYAEIDGSYRRMRGPEETWHVSKTGTVGKTCMVVGCACTTPEAKA